MTRTGMGEGVQEIKNMFVMTDRKIALFVKRFASGMCGIDKDGMCWKVCLPLVSLLSQFGVECELTEGQIFFDGEGWQHYWLTLKDGRIIDPTASQFVQKNGERMRDIYLELLPEYYKKYTAKDYDNAISKAVRDFEKKRKPVRVNY